MCLYAPIKSLRITDKDEFVFKIIKYTDDGNHWNGPYHDANLPFDEIVEVKPPKYEDTLYYEWVGQTMVRCGEGFFHSYTDLETAKTELRILERYHPTIEFKLTTASIPKNSVYYGDGVAAASSKLIVNKPRP